MRFLYTGSGSTFWPIWLKNLLLRLITLNFYYPWAKASVLRYHYAHTEFAGSRFEFHGTGRQLFKGYIVTIVALAFIYGLGFAVANAIGFGPADEQLEGMGGTQGVVLRMYFGFIVGAFLLLLLIPLAIHGTMRYRLANTTWRGIRMGYTGSVGGIYTAFMGAVLIYMFSLGLGTPWALVRVRRYIIGHIQIGQFMGAFIGRGSKLFMIYLPIVGVYVGFIIAIVIYIFSMGTTDFAHASTDNLTPAVVGLFTLMAVFILTLILVVFWVMRQVLRFQFDNSLLEHKGSTSFFHTSVTLADSFKIYLVYPLVQSLTFGLAAPWTLTGQIRTLVNTLSLPEDFPIDELTQVNPEYQSAVGEDLASVLDIDFGL